MNEPEHLYRRLLSFIKKSGVTNADKIAANFDNCYRECLVPLTQEKYIAVDMSNGDIKITYKGEAYLENEKLIRREQYISGAVGFILGIISSVLVGILTGLVV